MIESGQKRQQGRKYLRTGRAYQYQHRPFKAADDDLAQREFRQQLARRALQLMQQHFGPTTWRACWETVVNERPPAKVARELGITPDAVYLAKGRVLRRLRQELDGLWE